MLTKPFTLIQEDQITTPSYSPLHHDSRTRHNPEEIHEQDRSEEVDETKLDNECQEFLDDQILRKEMIKTFCDARDEYKVNKSWG